jgi:hypothetical protein
MIKNKNSLATSLAAILFFIVVLGMVAMVVYLFVR